MVDSTNYKVRLEKNRILNLQKYAKEIYLFNRVHYLLKTIL